MHPKDLPRVLTIAGSDSGGGAGIQADLKTFTALRVYGASVVTALTAQNTTGVQGIHIPPTQFVEKQLESVLSDIRFDAVKTGMLPTPEIIGVVANAITDYGIKTLVVDPVLVATSGDSLVEDSGLRALKSDLFPLATLVTPNLPEAERLLGKSIVTISDIRPACRELSASGCAILLKGGHAVSGAEETATDVLFNGSEFHAFSAPRVETRHTHGTGCTLASAIAAELAKGKRLPSAIETSKQFVLRGIQEGLEIGKGSGPLNHMHSI